MSRGTLDAGAVGATRGGAALDSAQFGFDPKSPGVSVSDYASQVASQLPAREGQTFDFVLIHPQRTQANIEVWTAFSRFLTACREQA